MMRFNVDSRARFVTETPTLLRPGVMRIGHITMPDGPEDAYDSSAVHQALAYIADQLTVARDDGHRMWRNDGCMRTMNVTDYEWHFDNFATDGAPATAILTCILGVGGGTFYCEDDPVRGEVGAVYLILNDADHRHRGPWPENGEAPGVRHSYEQAPRFMLRYHLVLAPHVREGLRDASAQAEAA